MTVASDPPVVPPEWFATGQRQQMLAWRAVEAQHVVATMRLVDTLDEQAVLEQLLESSKPKLPGGGGGAGGAGKHVLLTTPFRYRPQHGSRFRPAGAAGVWYGAATVRTACAEVAYWRWRFLMDSEGLQGTDLLTEHTVFPAQIDGLAINLRADPWRARRAAWTDPVDYRATQALAAAARAQRVQWLRYESVRDPGGDCGVVLDVAALDRLDLSRQQTWHCRTTRLAVRMVHGEDRHEWRFGAAAAVEAMVADAVPAPTTPAARPAKRPGSRSGA